MIYLEASRLPGQPWRPLGVEGARGGRKISGQIYTGGGGHPGSGNHRSFAELARSGPVGAGRTEGTDSSYPELRATVASPSGR